MYNPFSLKDKTILVTGASGGIGRAISIECSKMGAKVFVTGRDLSKLEETFNCLSGEGHLLKIADLSTPDGIIDLVNNLPELNGIVHCTGIASPSPITYLTKEMTEKIFQINYFSPIDITSQLLKKKILAKSSSIIFIASISGVFCSSVGGTIYSSTKAAISGAVKGMALDLAPRKIRVNTICPGMINTNIYGEGIITEEQLKLDAERYPLKRFGNPDEVAYAAIYLLSDASSWITGTDLKIDGGYTLL